MSAVTTPPPANATARQKAQYFLDHEQQFRLGMLHTEQQHTKTRGLAELSQSDLPAAIRLLQTVDRDLPPVMREVMTGPNFAKLVAAFQRAIQEKRKIFFTGCGATGRLSILLEACWRKCCQTHEALADYENLVFSVMAGGDFALIKSVEGYEDFIDFGRHQIRSLDLAKDDVVVAITEGGETSFVIGTAWEGVDVGAETFYVYNNKSDVLCDHVERSQLTIENENITKLCLASGPMAVAGSTRMQATTIELAVVGAALETAALQAMGQTPPTVEDYLKTFDVLLDEIETDTNINTMATITQAETDLYNASDDERGTVLYLAESLLLDVLTDTTERSPTFSLPPYRRRGDLVSPVSWSFVKDPLGDTDAAWEKMLGRGIRGIDWGTEQYEKMGAPAEVCATPPKLDRDEIRKFEIGNEPEVLPAKLRVLLVGLGDEALVGAADDETIDLAFVIGKDTPAPKHAKQVVRLDVNIGIIDSSNGQARRDSPLQLTTHLAAKLALNTLSTATMAQLGRLVSNWMIHVSTSNKKLIDRGIRLLSDQAALPYDDAAYVLFESIEEITTWPADRAKPSPVAHALDRLRSK